MDKNTMRAVVYDNYGSPDELIVREVPIPSPKVGEVLVKVIAAGVNPIDTYFRQGKLKWMLINKPPHGVGRDFAGIIETVGPDFGLSNFEAGQAIFGTVKSIEGGSYAEYAVAKISEIAPIPDNVSFEEAAALPVASLTALQSLRNLAHLSPHQRILINGGAGGVGLFAIQLAKSINAIVTATCGSDNMELCREYGADKVINYKETDIKNLNQKFDVFFDVVASESFSLVRGMLNRHGKYITTIPDGATIIDLARTALMTEKAYAILCKINTPDLVYISQLVAENKMKVLIDHTFTLEEAAKAHAQIESHHTRGKIVLRISEHVNSGETERSNLEQPLPVQ